MSDVARVIFAGGVEARLPRPDAVLLICDLCREGQLVETDDQRAIRPSEVLPMMIMFASEHECPR